MRSSINSRTNSHNWSEGEKPQADQQHAFTEDARTDGERDRNEPASCKTKLEGLLRIAAEQWPHKSPEDQAVERRFIERDYLALTGNRLTVKS